MEWQRTQDRVFTNWVNSVLKAKYKDDAPVVKDLNQDFRNGVILHKLLRALFDQRKGVKFPSYDEHPRTRINNLDNVTQALHILPQVGVMTVFLTPLQIVDGEHKMLLGLVWRLILASQIQALKESEAIGILGGDERQVDGGAKHALLEWTNKRTKPYNINVDNFGSSWRDGTAFLALLHSQNPNLFDMSKIDPSRKEENLQLAFNIAEKEFGIPRLIEAQDVLTDKPDERSIMTYVSAYAHKFDILGKLDTQMRTLDEREQNIAMKEAELARLAYENDKKLKDQTKAMLSEIENKESALRASHQRLNKQEEEQKLQLEKALAMQREADQRMRNAQLDQQRIKDEAESEKARLADLERRLREQADALEAQKRQFEQIRLESIQKQQELEREQARHHELQKQHDLDRIEKEFGDSANAFEQFLQQEKAKLDDPRTPITTLQQMVHFGIPFGNQLLQREKHAAQEAIKAGLQSNRYTTARLPEQETRWQQLIYEMQSKLTEMLRPKPIAPPPVQLPAIPFGGAFQPFKIASFIEKEPMLLLDCTASMNAPITRQKATPRIEVVKEAVKLLVDQIEHWNAALAHRKKGTGLRTITFSDGRAHDFGELHSVNFKNAWKKINFEGNTRIMPGWRLMQQAFNSKFAHHPVQERPVLLALVVTDGDALDIQEFERILAQDQNAYVVICIVGYGEERDTALQHFTVISKTNERLKIIPLEGGDDAHLIAGTLMSMIKN